MEKSELINYRMLLREVQQLRYQLDTLEASLYSPKGQRFTSMPHAASDPKKTMEDAVAGHLKLRDFYFERRAVKEAEQLRIEKAIDSLEDAAQRVIMRDRYIFGHSWRKVCDTMRSQGYSERQVFRLHGFALLNLKEA